MSGGQAVLTATRRGLAAAGLLRAGTTIVAGLSGGADSVALLHALVRVTKRSYVNVVAAHLDHGLRPASADDAKFCEELCARLRVRLRAGRAPSLAGRQKGGVEEASRLVRYSFLRRVAREEGASAIALAHTLNDQAETVLMRLIRGSAAEGLAGMQPWEGELLRPLLPVERAEVIAYLQRHDIAHVEDETNADPKYLRNRVRRELIPLLERDFNPQIVETLGRTARVLREEARTLSELANGLVDSARVASSVGIALDGERLRAAPPGLRRAALREAIRRAGGLRRVTATHIEGLDGLVVSNRGGATLPLPGDRSVEIRRGRVIVTVPESRSAERGQARLDETEPPDPDA